MCAYAKIGRIQHQEVDASVVNIFRSTYANYQRITISGNTQNPRNSAEGFLTIMLCDWWNYEY